MKALRALIFPLATLAFSAVAHAAPVQYQITATYHGEYIWDGTQMVPTDSSMFTANTQISATFFYDSAAPITSTNNSTTGSLSPFGPYSYYAGAVTNFSGTVLNHAFSSTTGSTLVADGNSGQQALDGIFHQTGSAADPTAPTNPGLTGFSIGDFTLTGFTAYSVGFSTMLSSQSLPADISATINFPVINVGLNLIFADSTGEYRSAAFWNGTITPVPLPSAALFFLSGLIGLGANAARKLKR